MGDIYDGVFRTILNDCRQLVIPLVNEAFGEHYSGDEEVEFLPNEHYIKKQDGKNRERITDTNFLIRDGRMKKYHWECQSTPDSQMLIRLFEYDAQIALDQGTAQRETLTVSFPNSAVLYLRGGQRASGHYQYVIKTPGGTVEYEVPLVKLQSYTLDEIFEKGLLMLIPFYIFKHERFFELYEENAAELAKLQAEYEKITDRLGVLERQGAVGYFYKRTIIELAENVLDELAKRYENVRKGVGDIMGGALIETEARKILNEGIEQGISQGIEQGISQGIKQGISQGIEQGISQGIEQGISQGIEQGIEKGRERERIDALGRMIRAGIPKEQILSCGYQEKEYREAEERLCVSV